MIELRSIQDIRRAIRSAHRKGQQVGFVPTMGYLHQGHFSLIELAKEQAEFVVVSIFVNPLQFNNPDDLENYPMDLSRDERHLKELGVDLLFLPDREVIYGENFQSKVTAGPLAERHCGASRPGHFDGVVTVVSALFNIIQPDIAVFGEKDFQQLRIIEQLVEDLHFPVKILRGPLIREADGLALSSRNVRLNGQERVRARSISTALQEIAARVVSGPLPSQEIVDFINNKIREAGLTPDYVAVVDERTLLPTEIGRRGDRVLVAAFAGQVRLIDNQQL